MSTHIINNHKITKPQIRRPVRVCTKCKERKVKCDRGHPCSSCVRRGVPSECEYTVESSNDSKSQVLVFESKQYVPPVDLHHSVNNHTSKSSPPTTFTNLQDVKLDYIGANIYNDGDDIINIFDILPFGSHNHINNNHSSPTSYRLFRGPLSWSFILKKDPSLNLLLDFLDTSKSAREILTVATNDDNYENTSGFIRAKALENENLEKQSVSDIYRVSVPKLSFIEKVLAILPDKNLIKFVINEFFQKLHPFLQYVEEEEFNEILNRIFVNYDNDSITRVEEINLKNRDDLAYIGITLIILRLGYLSIVSYNNKKLKQAINMPEVQFLLSNPINLKYIELSEECFKKFNIVSIPSYALLQFALMMRIYQKFSPEFGEGLYGGDSQLFTGIIIQMAYSLGLNRDPGITLSDISESEKLSRRKLWFSLIVSDMLEVFFYGNPFNTISYFYDTKPEFDFGAQDTKYKYLGAIWIEELKSLLLVLLDNSNKVKISDVVDKLNRFESLMKSVFGAFPKLLDPENITLKDKSLSHRSVGFKVWMVVYVLMLTAYVHLYLHFQKKRDFKSMFFYVRKLCITSSVDVLPSCYEIILNSDNIFGESASDLIFIPTILQLLHRSVLIIISFLIKCKFIEYNWRMNSTSDKIDPAIFRSMNSCTSLMKHVCQLFLKVVKILSPRYYYAWDIQVTLENYLNCSFNDQFYAKYFQKMECKSVNELTLNYEQINEMKAIFQISIQKVDEIEERYKKDLNDENILNGSESGSVMFNEIEIDNLFSRIFGTESNIESWSDFVTFTGGSMDYFHH